MEVTLSQHIPQLETKFQWLYPCFEVQLFKSVVGDVTGCYCVVPEIDMAAANTGSTSSSSISGTSAILNGQVTLRLNFGLKSCVSRQYLWTVSSVRMGRKEEPERSVSERRRREAIRRRRRGSNAQPRAVSMQLGGLGKRCKAPPAGPAEPGRQTTWCIFGLEMLYLARPSLAKTNAWKSFTIDALACARKSSTSTSTSWVVSS